jgi:3-hydroxyisobutyrate dehydrogenase
VTATVGFVGLGLMGQGFTRRLIEKGYRVVGFDADDSKTSAAADWGVTPVDSAAEVAGAADIVLVSVINTAAVEDVALGPRGLVGASKARSGASSTRYGATGKIMVDHSTTELEATKRIAAALAQHGMMFVDAPVSGGPGAAKAGTLAIMAGGSDAAIARIAPIMRDLGSFTHMGPVGTGQATKLVNQTIVLTNYCVLAEALRLAQCYGVDAAKLPQALKAGHAGSNMLAAVLPQMLAGDFAPRGFARQVLKDLEMLQAAAAARHLAMPMASQALTLYRLLVASGKSEFDAASVVTLYPAGDAG